jgi:hypothetical protein
MSGGTAAAADRDTGLRVRRRNLLTAMVGLLVVLGLVVLAGQPGAFEPYDPRSAQPSGLMALTEVLTSVGVQVDVSTSLPDDTSVTVLAPNDASLRGRHQAAEAFVRDGGTIVVGGPTALHELEPGPTGLADALAASARPPGCDLPALERVGRVLAPGWPSWRAEEPATPCFARPGGAVDDLAPAGWLVAVPVGEGTIVALASVDPLVNRYLDQEDNAALGAALLGPSVGDRVTFLVPSLVGGPDDGAATLLDLVPDGVRRAALLTGLAVLVLVVWRGRRLGQPVPERLPPVLPSAELARSVAGLLQRSGRRDQAAASLRADLRRSVGRALGTPGTAAGGSTVTVQTVTDRLPVDLETARRALEDLPVDDDAELARVAAAVAEVRAALRQAPQSPAHPPT